NNKAGACEPLTVNKANVTVDTAVKDSSTNATVTSEPLASQVYDRATVTGNQTSGFAPKGAVGFTLYGANTAGNSNTGDCTDLNSAGAGSSNVNGSTPTDPVSTDSNTSAKLHAGGFAYQASYTDTSGDYNNKAGACEPLTVNKANVTVDTAVKDSSTNATVTSEPLASDLKGRRLKTSNTRSSYDL